MAVRDHLLVVHCYPDGPGVSPICKLGTRNLQDSSGCDPSLQMGETPGLSEQFRVLAVVSLDFRHSQNTTGLIVLIILINNTAF